jgi:hypothetical protein
MKGLIDENIDQHTATLKSGFGIKGLSTSKFQAGLTHTLIISLLQTPIHDEVSRGSVIFAW